MPSDGPNFRDVTTRCLAWFQDNGMPPSALHSGQSFSVLGEDNAETSGICVEFPVTSTKEGIHQHAVAYSFELVPRSPQVVDVFVNCANKLLLIPLLDSSRTHSVDAATAVHPQLLRQVSIFHATRNAMSSTPTSGELARCSLSLRTGPPTLEGALFVLYNRSDRRFLLFALQANFAHKWIFWFYIR